MKIVEAKIENLPLIQEIAEKSWWKSYPGIISDEQIAYMLELMYSEKEITSHFNNPNYAYFLIQNDDSETVGIMGAEKDFLPNTTKLHCLYLLDEAKGKGFGKWALNYLKDWVKETGNQRIILNVNKQNQAKHVYASQGFKTYSEEVLQIGNSFVMDDYQMEFLI